MVSGTKTSSEVSKTHKHRKRKGTGTEREIEKFRESEKGTDR